MKTKCFVCKLVFNRHKSQFKKSKLHFCSKNCHFKYQRTDLESNERLKKISRLGVEAQWKNHEHNYHANGYVLNKPKNHPYANKRGYVYKHRLVMENKLCRYLLPSEVVHHKDGNKLNNDISNLVMFRTTNEHTTYHLLNGEVGNKKSKRRDDAKRLLQSREI